MVMHVVRRKLGPIARWAKVWGKKWWTKEEEEKEKMKMKMEVKKGNMFGRRNLDTS